jgi:hypothetical protein
VEGTTEGSDREGTAWYGGQTPGGRFCSIFIFNNAGLIERMYIYVDPDFTGKHEGRFLWPDREQQKW